MLSLKKFVVLAVIATVSSVASLAHAQSPSRSLAGSVYGGIENVFQRDTLLIFAFNADGTALMADANTKPNQPKTLIHGSYTQNGDQVSLRFGNCTYRGQISGQMITGVAQFDNQQRTWNFRIQFVPPQQGQPVQSSL